MSGELIPVSIVARVQSAGLPVLFLQRYSDHNFFYKLQSANIRKADVLVLGSSRANQWRSQHFLPYTFYNAGNVVFRWQDFTQFLTELQYDPKAIIFSLDFFMFEDKWTTQYEQQAKGDIKYPKEAELLIKDLLGRYIQDPIEIFSIPIEPIYGRAAIGMSATEFGSGFRLDGSYQYGGVFLGRNPAVIDADKAIGLMKTGVSPLLFSDKPSDAQIQALTAFVQLARSRGISLIGVTTAYDPALVAAMNSSPQHEIWRTFRSEEFRRYLEKLGVLTFDFTDIASFNGKTNEFIDAFHPTEPSISRQLLAMLMRKEVRELFPDLDSKRIRSALNSASRFEVYPNQF